MRWNGWMRCVLFGIMLVLLAGSACGGEGEEKETVSSPEGTSASKKPVVLRVGTTKPFKTTNMFGDYWYGVLRSITTHDCLVRLGPDMTLTPDLATAWEVSPDSLRFTFTIAQGVTWHDGVPLTPEDVRFSIEYYRDKVSYAAWMKDIVKSVRTEGQQVIVKLSKPYGNLLTEFMSYDPIPKHIWQKVENPDTYEAADRTIGCGPFKFESWDEAAKRFVFVANESYYRGRPNIDRLEIEVFGNMDALVMALARGEIDTWWDYSGEFPYTYVPTLLKSGKIEFASTTFLGVPAAIGFNLDHPPLDRVEVRRALSQAINYPEIVDLVFYNYGTVPSYGFVPPTHANFNDAVASLAYDPDGARALLDTAGLVDTDGDGVREMSPGDDITLTLLARSDTPSTLRCAEMVKRYFEAVGIGSRIVAVDSATWVARKDAMDYDIVFFRATPWGTLMHAGHGTGYFDSRRTGQGVLHNLSAPEYLEACDARLGMAVAAEQRELDLRLQALHEEYVPGVALAWIESVYPYRKGWENWVIDPMYGGIVNSFSWFTVTRAE